VTAPVGAAPPADLLVEETDPDPVAVVFALVVAVDPGLADPPEQVGKFIDETVYVAVPDVEHDEARAASWEECASYQLSISDE